MPPNGFEVREAHRDLSAPAIGRPVYHPGLSDSINFRSNATASQSDKPAQPRQGRATRPNRLRFPCPKGHGSTNESHKDGKHHDGSNLPGGDDKLALQVRESLLDIPS